MTDADLEAPLFDFEQYATKDEAYDDWKSALLFGNPGAGKSWLAGSAAELGKVLYLDTEGGAASAIRPWRKTGNITPIAISSHKQLEFMVHKVLTEKHDYETVVVDTVGTAQARAEKYFRSLPSMISPKTGEIDGFKVFGALKDWLVAPTWRDDQDVIHGGLAWKLHEAPFRGILVAHDKQDRDESGAVSIIPSLLGGAKDSLASVPDIVGYLTREEVDKQIERVLIVQSGGALTTKNRFGLPKKIYQPSFSKIAELIEEGASE